jgi:predicted deacylase
MLADGAGMLARTTRWVRAGRSGICRLDVELGQHVKKGQQMGRIGDALGDSTARLRARCDGIIIGRRVHPLVYQGEGVVHIAELEPAG